MDTKKVLFRRAFCGYDRNAVNEYIIEANRGFSEESRELNDRLAALSGELSDSREHLASVVADLAECDEQRCQYAQQLDRLNGELEERRRENAELASLAEKRLQTSSELAAVAEKRASQLEELSASAQRDREELEALRKEYADYRRNAEREIARVKEQYDTEAGERIAALGESCSRMYGRMSSELREFTKKCLRSILSGVSGMRDDLGVIGESAGSRADGMLKSIDVYEAEMKAQVRRLLDEFSADGPV